ncbi:hypothetical protein RFF05_00555 [Bengtsoniella intestinalis]|uniref:hypothetical protein n=1 Tax=Bengtsoniella intestinalis TaxID=3073143 RepID=UPI00391F8367
MDEFMRTLQQTFQPPLPDQRWMDEREIAWAALHDVLGKEDRKLLLRLVDANNLLQEEVSLHSFTYGLKVGVKFANLLQESKEDTHE